MAVRYKSIISYAEIVKREDMMLQKGMNFRIKSTYSIILMSVRKGAPYRDKWHDETGILEYEGHDELRRKDSANPKVIDQPMCTANGSLTENGKFYEAVQKHKAGHSKAEPVQVYEKIAQGVWCDRGRYELIDAKFIHDGARNVFRFFLKPMSLPLSRQPYLRETRVIPTIVKVEVWKRDQGKCVICGSDKNLHFDHDIPYSKGGSSITAQNVRLLCAKHNLSKSDKIMSVAPWLTSVASFFIHRTG
ncbi:MAG: HNH endonuclease [Sedimentisphaerales bacterium]|nr:HNH endonuclease [Sedimentisphaerales bacterium]